MAAETFVPHRTGDDRNLQRRLGYWSLVAIGIGSVIGSGWLFSAMYAAQAAGPASLVAWVVGGVIMLALALVNAELGMTCPESGGLNRYPLYSNGRLAAAVIGWCSTAGVIGVPALESAGVMQYASSYLPGLYHDGSLTPLGIGSAAVLMAVFTFLNYFGVKLMSHSNNIVTAIKVLTPVLTVVALLISSFIGAGQAGGVSNLVDGGGFAPFGVPASLGIIATAGILFAYNGAQVIVTLSGEAKNPRRTVPAAMITTILFTIVLYIGLQVAFLLAAPHSNVIQGWAAVKFDSPFGDLAMIAGIQWLYWILVGDAAVSPSGAAIVGVASNARSVFALAKNRFLPAWLQKVDPKWGVPRRALAVNYVVGLAFLLPMPSWHALIGVIGLMVAFTFGIASISAGVFRRVGVTTQSTRIRGVGTLAPLTFAAGGLVVSWVPWSQVAATLPLVAIGLVWYAVNFFVQKHDRAEISGGLWLLVFFAFLYLMTYLGSFGAHVIEAPWDSIIVGIGGLIFYRWGVVEGTRYMSRFPQIAEDIRATDDGELKPHSAPAVS